MTFGRWALGAVAGGLALGAVGAQAAPMPLVTSEAPSSVQTVQFYYYGDPPPVFYDPPPVFYSPPPRRYYGPPRERHWERGPPPRVQYAPPRAEYAQPRGRHGFRDREAPNDYRRAQREMHKDRVRTWNRANGY